MEFKTANITYKGLEDKGLTFNLIDEKNGKWTIWKKDKKTGEDSEVYQSLQNYKMGDSFGVSYGEKENSFIGKDGKTVKYMQKTIYSILPIIAQPTTQQAPKANIPNTYIKNETEAPDWDNIAVGKCQTVFLQAYIQSGKSFADAKLQVTQARQLAELVVFGEQKTIPTAQVQDQEPLPSEPQEVDVNSIPF